MLKKNKMGEHQDKMMIPPNIRSQSELRKILNERNKVPKSISFININDDGEDDEIIMEGAEGTDHLISKNNIIDGTVTTSTLPRYDLLNLKNVIIEPDDQRSRNN
jgi:hypothetical protein